MLRVGANGKSMTGTFSTTMKLWWAPLATLAAFQFAPAVLGGEPAFDCAKASSDVERMICASDELGTLDRQLTTAYRALQDTLSPGRRAALVRDQQAWLQERDECCGLSDPPTQGGLVEAYSIRLRELDAIARRPEVFTDRGWDVEHPTLHGDAFAQLPPDTQNFVYRQIRNAFQPERIADHLAGLTLKDSHSGELFLDFTAQPICHGLAEFTVGASRTNIGKHFQFWRGIFYKNVHFIEGASFSAGAVQKCMLDEATIVVETDDDYGPRAAEVVVTNVSRNVIDTTTFKATVDDR
jgi:uncharacterized protein